ncbi:hypothetical protein POVCU2_0000870, partial [Plasmodium ovale curtisi]
MNKTENKTIRSETNQHKPSSAKHAERIKQGEEKR